MLANNTRQEFTFLDLFCGCGGFTLGLERASFRCLAAIDFNTEAVTTFKANFRKDTLALRKDLTKFSPAKLAAQLGVNSVDVIVGGPPCQAFSYNSHLRTHRGVIAGLFREYLRLVQELNPRYLVMENVPGILSIGNGGVVGEIASYLGALGYETDGRILYAEDFGVPQQRRRMIFIASRVGLPAEIFPMGSHGPAPKPIQNELVHRWEPEEHAERLIRVWSAIVCE